MEKNEKTAELLIQNNIKLSKEYANLKEQYEKIAVKSTPKSKTYNINLPKNQPKSHSEVTRKIFKTFENEIASLGRRLSIPNDIEIEYKLEVQIRELEKKLKSLKKENDKLNKATLQIKDEELIIQNPEHEIQKEINQINKKIKKTETETEKDNKMLDDYTEKIPALEQKAEKLKEKLSRCKERNDNKIKIFDDMNKKLEIIANSWKANVAKYQQGIKEMEDEEMKIRERVIGIKSKVFKKDQQMRLLHMTRDELIMMKNTPDKPDDGLFHPDVNFLYKPSVNALYI